MLTSKSNWKCCRSDVVVGGSDFNLMMSIVALHRDCDSVTLAASCELSLSRRNYVHAQPPSAHTLWNCGFILPPLASKTQRYRCEYLTSILIRH